MKINTIVFDMGGVLLDFGAELFSRRLHVGAEGEALLRQHLLCTTDWVRLDRGTITEEEVYAHACARLPAELHAAAEYIIYHWNEPIVPITGTADVVRELKARGYTLYLLSNAARRQHTYWHDIPGSECFSGTLISADVHLLKPEAAIYQALFDKFDLTASSCLFIDDFPPNIEAAENAGMQGIVFHDAGQLRVQRNIARHRERSLQNRIFFHFCLPGHKSGHPVLSYWCRLYHKHLVHSSPYGTFSANSAKRQKNVCFLALLPNREQAAQQRKQAARLGHLLPYVQTGWA